LEKDQAYDRDVTAHLSRIVAQAEQALRDDAGAGDITTLALASPERRDEEAVILAKSEGILCGLLEARMLLEAGGLAVRAAKREGDRIAAGDIIARVTGDVQELLTRERTALNYLQILSGIATKAHGLAARHPAAVASLRKTHPGLCFSEKRAVRVGGGYTHRLGLSDGFLIKDNHLAMVARQLYGDVAVTEAMKLAAIEEALTRVARYRSAQGLRGVFVEVEVETLAQALTAAQFHRARGVPDMILLDNLRVADVAQCVQSIRHEAGPGILIEASGGISPETAGAYLDAGCDVVSMSQLTFDAPPLDISMKIVKYK
jgi:nicotinate-nucleotide pyrophosphorylase (carboxylating)